MNMVIGCPSSAFRATYLVFLAAEMVRINARLVILDIFFSIRLVFQIVQVGIMRIMLRIFVVHVQPNVLIAQDRQIQNVRNAPYHITLVIIRV